MRFGSTAATAVLLFLGLTLVFCSGGDRGEGGEGVTTLPDTLETFTKKLNWLIPKSFQSLEYACQTFPDSVVDAAINLNVYLPQEEFFSLFKGIDVRYRSLYYGWEAFSSTYPVDPGLPMDSTLALLQLEARSRLVEQVRLVEEQVSNITDETTRRAMENDLSEMRATLEKIESSGVSLYGAEVQGLPNDLKSLMFRPEGYIRVIFRGVPQEGSWVRMSPYDVEKMMAKDRIAAGEE
jgi:hypothetical protein